MKTEEKKYRIKLLEISIQTGIFVLVIFSSAYLYYDGLPNVVYTSIYCPSEIRGGAQVDVSLTNYGGSNSVYTVFLQANDGLKCYVGEKNGFEGNDIAKLNKKYNQKLCKSSHFIGEGATSTDKLVVFINDTITEHGNFNIYYNYKTFFIIPSRITTRTSKDYHIISCEYKYNAKKNSLELIKQDEMPIKY